MSFNSIPYLLFLPAVLAGYWLLPHRLQNFFLLAASYFFLGFVHPWFIILIFSVSLTHYLAAMAMQRWPHLKKYILVLSLVISLGLLAFFKYANFFLENFTVMLQWIGLPSFTTTLSILLPVGISFYTFQAIAYSIDVYRGKMEPQKNIFDLTLFISFFPQLVAGPIERSKDLMPQVVRPRHLSAEQCKHGLLLLLWGFFKKVVIADNCGLITHKVFSLANPDFYILWAGVYAFAIQILADFWSYTDIARGTAMLFGFKLSRNFNHPYFSTSPADFWRRWHMSLSYWLRDYVYIPLGGSRTGMWRAQVNIMITFLLSGLWHGASWNFVLWGAYHGLLVVLHRVIKSVFAVFLQPSLTLRPVINAGKIFITFLLVSIGWLMFRVTDIDRLQELFMLSPLGVPADSIHIALYLFFVSFLYSLPIWMHGIGNLVTQQYMTKNGTVQLPEKLLLLRPLLMLLLFIGILTLRSPKPSTFIYFQF
jgi:D-alanyl-lipoteichoic acid acyltransferase DltB (MBOAT superfamily)